MRICKTAGAAIVAGAALLMAPPSASAQMDQLYEPEAQQRPIDLRAKGGFAVPATELREYAETGLHLGGEAAWWMNDYVAVRLDGNVDALPGLGGDEAPTVMPDIRFWHYGGGLDFDLMGRNNGSPMSLQAKVGAGATTLDTEDLIDPPAGEDDDITQTYPNVNAGVEVGYQLAENVAAAVGTTAYFAFVEEEDLETLQEMNPAAEPMDIATMFPITATVRIGIPN